VLGFAFLWALVLLTYLLPPAEIYGNLISGTLTRNQTIFLTAATLVLTIEFLLARHLFCRFGCAVGLFQSLAWMANDRAMVVGFDTRRAAACQDCNNACDNACPMRLKPRTLKRACSPAPSAPSASAPAPRSRAGGPRRVCCAGSRARGPAGGHRARPAATARARPAQAAPRWPRTRH
jgi:ferredoxin-type protein NapH